MPLPIRVIATDEAGYGPKLGPLVIAATAYRVGATFSSDLSQSFEPLRRVHHVKNAVVLVNDSKTIFKPKSTVSSRYDPLANLHATVSVANSWSADSERDFPLWLEKTASTDWRDISRSPWLAEVDQVEFLHGNEVQRVADCWSESDVKLTHVRSRVITAAKFNVACSNGRNKADLLSESTLGLVRELLETPTDAEETRVFCDRHGGRRYYAAVLSHVLKDAEIIVVSESKGESIYRVKYQGHVCHIHFTVKGDSFAPVALSSIYAKYIRERLMQSFNRYFATLHREPLKPTAGYPSDANRFLRDIAPILSREKIADEKLIRMR
jgi:ribonuclease HII